MSNVNINLSNLSNEELKKYIKKYAKTANTRITRLKKAGLYDISHAVKLKWGSVLSNSKFASKKGMFTTGQKTRTDLMIQAQNIRNFLTSNTTISGVKKEVKKQLDRLNIEYDNLKKDPNILKKIYDIYNATKGEILAINSDLQLQIITERVQSNQDTTQIINDLYQALLNSQSDSDNFLRIWSDNYKYL